MGAGCSLDDKPSQEADITVANADAGSSATATMTPEQAQWVGAMQKMVSTKPGTAPKPPAMRICADRELGCTTCAGVLTSGGVEMPIDSAMTAKVMRSWHVSGMVVVARHRFARCVESHR